MKSARITGQASPCSDDPVAGNEDGDRIVSHSAANGLSGHAIPMTARCNFACDFAISRDFPIWNFTEDGPHCLAERSSNWGEGKFTHVRLIPGKIPVEPVFDSAEERESVVFHGGLGSV